MTTPHIHAAVIELWEPMPAEVAAGADTIVKVKLACPAGCDLSGVPVMVTAPDGATMSIANNTLPIDDGADIRSIALTAPRQLGDHTWRLATAAQEVAGVSHAAGTLDIAVRTRPRETSLAVWSIPSPVVTGRRFSLKVGAKSSAGCTLHGHRIEVRDERGIVIAGGSLGETPWLGTSALYWTELELDAPAAPGMFSWSVKFDPADLALPHDGASSSFTIAIVRPPEHRLTVKVKQQATAAPIQDALVRLGAFCAATDESGLAEIMMPKGTYDLNVWKAGYEAPARAVAIDADVTVEIEVAALPEENPDAAWQM
jgi:hypothetical protein